MRSFFAGFTMVVMSIGLAGCTGSGAVCTAEGYLSVATITLSDPRADVSLELCDGAGCEPGVPPQGDTGPADTSPAPFAADTGVVRLQGDGESGWSATFVGGQSVVEYRLRDASGQVVSEGNIEVDWVRVGGTDECGGPREAAIELPG